MAKLTTDPIIEDISLDLPWSLVETFSRMPRWQPKDVNRSADTIVKLLKAHDVPVTVHEPSLYLSIPYEASVKVGSKVYAGKPPAYCRDVRDGLSGELIYAPSTQARNILTLFDKGQDPALWTADRIKGKIVITEGLFSPSKVLDVEAKGAIGMIMVNPGADAHWGICTTIWGTPDLADLPRKPTIPVVSVSNPDGRELMAVAERKGKVTLFARMEEGWFTQKVPVVDIPGRGEPDKFVLLHGHYDSWDVGVGDNATGDATLLELARVLWKNKRKLHRSVRIAWWPGHSTGRYAGSTWFADEFALDLDENCVAQVNCDSPGCRWATVFKDMSWMTETEGYMQSVIKAVTGLESHGERPHRAGDYSFNNIGISSFLMLSSTMPDELRAKKGYYAVGGCGANIAWHTEHDTMEIADREMLLRDMQVYAQAVIGVANAEVLPFDWTATTREFSVTIEKYQKAAGNAFDLTPAGRAVTDLEKALKKFNRATKNGDIKPKTANAVIQGLARILVPINFTREPRFRHDPAVPIPPLPTLAAAVEIRSMPKDRQGFARTELTRGQNRFVAALRQAQRMVEAAM